MQRYHLSGAKDKEDTGLCLQGHLKMTLSHFHLTCERCSFKQKSAAPNMFLQLKLTRIASFIFKVKSGLQIDKLQSKKHTTYHL